MSGFTGNARSNGGQGSGPSAREPRLHRRQRRGEGLVGVHGGGVEPDRIGRRRQGASARPASRASRRRMSARTVAGSGTGSAASAFAASSRWRRPALTSGAAVTKSFTVARGRSPCRCRARRARPPGPRREAPLRLDVSGAHGGHRGDDGGRLAHRRAAQTAFVQRGEVEPRAASARPTRRRDRAGVHQGEGGRAVEKAGVEVGQPVMGGQALRQRALAGGGGPSMASTEAQSVAACRRSRDRPAEPFIMATKVGSWSRWCRGRPPSSACPTPCP